MRIFSKLFAGSVIFPMYNFNSSYLQLSLFIVTKIFLYILGNKFAFYLTTFRSMLGFFSRAFEMFHSMRELRDVGFVTSSMFLLRSLFVDGSWKRLRLAFTLWNINKLSRYWPRKPENAQLQVMPIYTLLMFLLLTALIFRLLLCSAIVYLMYIYSYYVLLWDCICNAVVIAKFPPENTL